MHFVVSRLQFCLCNNKKQNLMFLLSENTPMYCMYVLCDVRFAVVHRYIGRCIRMNREQISVSV